jgi:imidazole glycerol-phosphate synthase subunit HisH
MTRIAILDYGVGNLHSLAKALAVASAGVEIEPDARRAVTADALVLPGVGAFSPAAARLAVARDTLREAIVGGLPTLGVCLGMQLLFDSSEEGPGAGLGILPGRVTALAARRLPQIGWNSIDDGSDPLLSASGLRTAYYANGFAARPEDPSCVRGWSVHESDRFPAVVRRGACVGVQFHPEKSSDPGVRFLESFLRVALASDPLTPAPTRS